MRQPPRRFGKAVQSRALLLAQHLDHQSLLRPSARRRGAVDDRFFVRRAVPRSLFNRKSFLLFRALVARTLRFSRRVLLHPDRIPTGTRDDEAYGTTVFTPSPDRHPGL